MNDSGRWHVHFCGGEKVLWALDEDLRMAREALGADAVFGPLSSSRIVHSAYWPRLLDGGAAALRGKSVLCFADNPPSFNLTQEGFLSAASLVDLWIARTREAEAQFRTLELPVTRAPYAVDEAVFRPLPPDSEQRRALDIPEDALVIGNFHRDSEGSNLLTPKRQKGADLFFEIVRTLHQRRPNVVILLAGPRRGYLRAKLREAGVPYRFVGTVLDDSTDDYAVNILPRARLNELYQLLDVCLISSRWEGGPHSLLEALFAGRTVLSTPVGIARDVLPPECLFRTAEEAVAALEAQAKSRVLQGPTADALRTAQAENSQAALRQRLLAIYADLPRGKESASRALRAAVSDLTHRLTSRFAGKAEIENARARVVGNFTRVLSSAPPPALDHLVETPLDAAADPELSRRLLLDAARICLPRPQA